MATQQEAPSIEETLTKTDFGTVINENKNIIMIIGAVVLALIIGYSVFNQIQASKDNKIQNKAFTIKESVFTPFIESKTDAAAFLLAAGRVDAELVGNTLLFSSLFQAADKLIKESKTADAANLLKTWSDSMEKSSPLYFFTALKLVPVYEDMGKFSEAVVMLESLVSQKSDILKAKIYLDLGRNYIALGEKEKAKSNLDYVLEKYKNSESAKLAKLYLGNL